MTMHLHQFPSFKSHMDNRTSGIDDFHHVYIMFFHLNLHLQRIFHDFPIFSQDVPLKNLH